MQADGSQLTADWLESRLGRALLRQEARIVEEALDGVFGESCLQLGLWGEPRGFLRFTRTQRCSLVATAAAEGVAAIGDMHRLPVASDSIDAVLLPHTLDFTDRPHAVLREVDRVLRRDGRVIILGFKPGGVWGLRRLLTGSGVPPGVDQLISERRMKDWLKLLDMRIDASQRYFFRWPFTAPAHRRHAQVGASRQGVVAGVCRLLHAECAETRQHADAGTPGLESQAESRRRPG